MLTVIQARTGSTRLPGKCLLPLGGSTVLGQMCRRVKRARRAGLVVVATTNDSADDAIAFTAEREGVACFRGHSTDLLDRHYQAMVALGSSTDGIVKIPSDCPLIDPAVIDAVIARFLERGDADYVSNLHPPSWPDGNDVEVMSRAALTTAWREAAKGYEREHTTPFLWDNPGRFRIENVAWGTGRDLSRRFRYTLDYPEDYEVISAIFRALHPKDPCFGVDAIVALLEGWPELGQINEKYLGHAWTAAHAGELTHV